MPFLRPHRHSPLIPNHRKCYINLIQEHFSWYHLSKIHKRALSPLSPFDVSVLGDLGESRPFHRLFHPSAFFPLNTFLSCPIGNFTSLPLVQNTAVCPHQEKGSCMSYPSTPPAPDTPQSLVLWRRLCRSYKVSTPLRLAHDRDFD